jgi:mannose-6-phosphate isomerase
MQAAMDELAEHLLVVAPQYRERVWGGRRLMASDPPIGEAWLAFGSSIVGRGEYAGRSLDALMSAYGSALMGTAVHERYPGRFPLLVKLLDCAEWLSVQVHPNDEQARRMVGPGESGKTEAWYFLEAEPGARIIAGVKPGVGAGALAAAIREGRVTEVAEYVNIGAGDALLIPAGTLHALGPGLLLYEIQQASDTTYRAYDWGRPQSDGRALHIEESVAVTQAVGPAGKARPEIAAPTGSAVAVACGLFEVDLVTVSPATSWPSGTGGRSLHLITVTEGTAEIAAGGELVRLDRFETALIAGTTGPYEIRAVGGPARLLRAMVPN